MSWSSRWLLGPLLLACPACYEVPEDTSVQAVEVEARGGALAACLELKVELDAALVAVGACDAVDPLAGGTPVPADVIEAIRAGVDDSEFRSVDVPPDCAGCPTRTYRVTVTAPSANLQEQLRILPSPELVDSLGALGSP